MVLSVINIILLVLLLAFSVNVIEKIIREKRDKISFKESMDLTDLPIITLYNGKTKINFLLDTGSNLSHINKSYLDNLEYQDLNIEQDTIGMEGNKVTSKVCRIQVFYKENRYEEEFVASDLDNAFNTIKQESGVQIHGILGNKFFEKYKYVLDFSNLTAYVR
jgi:hypothetical protein